MSKKDRGGASIPLSLEHLIALNDEIAALSRTGLPLERGLSEVGRDLSGNLSAAMLRLSGRMEGGSSLAEAMALESRSFPPVYRAVVTAGVRSGRLPDALEGLGDVVRTYAEAREAIGLALWYPLLVLALAYGLLILMLGWVVPRFLDTFPALGVATPWFLRRLETIGEWVPVWGPALPVLLGLLTWWWVGSGRAAAVLSVGSGRILGWFPWMGSLLAYLEAASLARLLATLVEHEVPFPEAIRLASEASGDRALARAGEAIASGVERGEGVAATGGGARGFPPLLRWVLTTAGQGGDLAPALRQLAGNYRERALRQAEKIRYILPVVFLLTIGGSATLGYCLSLFLPLTALLRGLAAP